MNFRKSLSILFVTIFAGIPPMALADSIPDEQYVIQAPPTTDRYTGISIEDSIENRNTFTSLEARTADGTSPDSKLLSITSCKKVGADSCGIEKYFHYYTQLKYCNSMLTTDCISSVFAKDQDGAIVEGKFVRNYPGVTQYAYEGDPALNLPPGGSNFIVDFPSLPHQGGSQYLVVGNMLGSKSFLDKKFHLDDFSAGIFAVSEVPANSMQSSPATNSGIRPNHTVSARQNNAGGIGTFNGKVGRTPCVQSLQATCLISWPLSLKVEFGMTMKLHTKLTGWIHGRLSDVSVDISIAKDGDQNVTFKGKPSVIPGISAWFKKTELPLSLAKIRDTDRNFDSSGLGWPGPDNGDNPPDGIPYSILKERFGYHEGAFKEVLAWIDAVGDTASYAPTVWSVRSIESGSEFTRCSKNLNSLSGVVTTNATMYIASPPTYNKADQTLDYKVIAPHYLPNGSEFKGMYNLGINGDVARCMYGYSKAPVSATVSIISSDGTSQVATAQVGERNGWLYLSVNNFTFSSPVVKVKLTQASNEATSPAAAVVPVVAKKFTIFCKKGTRLIKVYDVKPVCPLGYKKR